jgi:hypothetical protein
MKILEHIQNKDSASKSRFSLMVAGVITGVIALVWVTTLPARIGEKISLDSKSESEKVAETEEKKDFGSIVGEAKNQLGSLMQWKEQLDNKSAPSSDTALGSLSEGGSTASTSTELNQIQASSTAVANAASTTVTTPPTPPETAYVPEATTTPVTQEPPVVAPPPKVILIGTTTAQKSE